MTWQSIRIGDIGRVVTGDTPPKSRAEFYGSAFPFIKPTDMKVGQRYTSSWEENYSEEAYEKYKQKLIPEGSTAVVTIGSIGQKLTLTRTPCFVNQAVNAVIPDREKFDPMYVYYLLKHNLHLVKQADTGASSGRENVSKSNFSSLEIYATLDFAEQVRIAGVLDSLDSAIENNQCRIALMEESARLLYREWFVHFRFPGNDLEGVSYTDWTERPLSELISINPKTQFETDRAYPFVPMQSLSETSMLISDVEERVIQGGAKFQNLDTLLARITPCLENGKTGFVQFLTEEAPVASGSTEFIVLRGQLVSPFWVYCLAREDSFRSHVIGSMVGSDGRQRVNTKCFDSYLARQPPPGLLEAFDAAVKPVFEEVEVLARVNRQLRICRDELLPRLMSGTIEV